MKKINVNARNSKVIGGRLFITGMKMARLSPQLTEGIVRGSTIKHPSLGDLYEYSGAYNRASNSELTPPLELVD